MQNVTIRLREELIDRLDEEATDKDISRSEYARQILDERHKSDELEQEVQQLTKRLESRENRIQELEEQLKRRSQIEEKVDTLAKRQEEPEPPFVVKWYRWLKSRN